MLRAILASSLARDEMLLSHFVNILIQQGSDVDKNKRDLSTPLQAAASSPQEFKDLTKALLAFGAMITIKCGRHGTALRAGTYSGDEEALQPLLEGGKDENIAYGEHCIAIGAVAFQGHRGIAQIVLQNGPDPGIEAGGYRNAWWGAAYNVKRRTLQQILKDLESVKKSIADKVDLNARGGIFSSGLHTSALYGYVDIVDLLLSQTVIKVNLPDSRGHTPL
ncbi:hypothetical protein FGADI_7592 [Fusarium gaditjirri]|uniref:Ankyrin repeat protein n=1 Tax=Fusarium gaditjirri TaxID=282569 RepID=A0A8H4T4S8_9HYPO|nr:hypothetical protein FGADI_7592 [Fusarium gaditjirri]